MSTTALFMDVEFPKISKDFKLHKKGVNRLAATLLFLARLLFRLHSVAGEVLEKGKVKKKYSLYKYVQQQYSRTNVEKSP